MLFELLVILMSQHVTNILEIIAITPAMAKRTDFIDRPVDGLNTKGCDLSTKSVF